MNLADKRRIARPATLLLSLPLLVALLAACSENGPTDLVESDGRLTTAGKPDGVGNGNGGGGGGGDADTTYSVEIVTSVPGSGLYADELGPYDGRAGSVGAECPRQMVLDLTDQSTFAAWPLNSPECPSKGFARITLPDIDWWSVSLYDVVADDPTIEPTTNLCCVLNYYFGDNVVWKQGIRVVDVQEPMAGTRFVKLSTLPVDGLPALSDAEIWDRGKGRSVTLVDQVTAHLELEVTITTSP